jgi:deoxyribodipyrimidine photo-lyase
MDAEEVIPLFVLTPSLLSRPDICPERVDFLFGCLQELDHTLRLKKTHLIILEGEPEVEIPKLAQETGAMAVYCHGEVEPWGQARDQRVYNSLKAYGVAFRQFPGLMVHEPENVLSGFHRPYSIYTAFRRSWNSLQVTPPLPAPERMCSPLIPVADISANIFARSRHTHSLFPDGEKNARARWKTFMHDQASHYHFHRDYPAAEGTSRLSPYLKFGAISPREIVFDCLRMMENLPAEAQKSLESFLGEIAWRDFYLHVLYHFPHVESGCFQIKYDTLKWENSDALFEAWKTGKTGYPIVDAGMRQLLQEGWMHNRLRMIVASFLTKDLLINWQWGEKHFMQHLVDGDLAANNGGWQWAASTGTDAQPYFRIFNPELQGRKFDPTGEYVRKYVPELQNVPDKWIHSPWKMSAVTQRDLGFVLGGDYPYPVIDHSIQRIRAQQLFSKPV